MEVLLLIKRKVWFYWVNFKILFVKKNFYYINLYRFVGYFVILKKKFYGDILIVRKKFFVLEYKEEV